MRVVGGMSDGTDVDCEPDARRVALPKEPPQPYEVGASIPQPAHLEVEPYTVRVLATADGEHRYLAHERMSDHEAIGHLLRGYRRRTQD